MPVNKLQMGNLRFVYGSSEEGEVPWNFSIAETEGRGSVAQKEDLHGSDEGCAFPSACGGGQCRRAGGAAGGEEGNHTLPSFQREDGED